MIKFNLKKGGSIVWDGDPLEAQMNIQALYSVPGGANPAYGNQILTKDKLMFKLI